jgi:hypothetical protein
MRVALLSSKIAMNGVFRRHTGLHSQSRRTYFFESFSYAAELSADSTLLEKSIRSGCSAVYTSKNKACQDNIYGSNVTEIYELLSDLTSTEEIAIEEFMLGHCLDLHPANIEQEMQVITDTLSKTRKSLDFATLLLRSPEEDSENKSGLDATRLQSAVTALDEFPQFEGRIGFHFSTALLANASTEELDELLDSIHSVLQGVSRPLLIAVAANYLSQENALRVAAWAKCQNAKIIACEVLRMDERRPGLLCLPTLSAASGAISINATISTKNAVIQAMEDLKVSMDRCLHMERQFLEKLHNPGDGQGAGDGLVRQLCVAHVLLHIQNNLHSLEEWDYLLKTNIHPGFEAALEEVRKQSKATADWAAIYTSLARHLFECMSVLHRTRKYMVCDDILQTMNNDGMLVSDQMTPQTVEQVEKDGDMIPAMLAAASKKLIDADYVALSGIEVLQKQWKQKLKDHDGRGAEVEVTDSQRKTAQTTLSKVDSICSSYV